MRYKLAFFRRGRMGVVRTIRLAPKDCQDVHLALVAFADMLGERARLLERIQTVPQHHADLADIERLRHLATHFATCTALAVVR